MQRAKEVIERGLEIYQSLVSERSELEDEFVQSREVFFAGGLESNAEPDLAERRHLEWFLLERPSDSIGGVPAEALLPEWLEQADPLQADHTDAFLQSHAGTFEVTTADPERGVWLRDLLGHGEYPIQEPDAASGLRGGDLLVGRLFPIGGGVFLLSPAVGCFRSPGLVDAVREDMERMRASRRGVMRMEQAELERLFFAAGRRESATDSATQAAMRAAEDDAADVPSIDVAAERERAREGLREAGVPRSEIECILREVRVSAEEGRPVVTEVLNDLAMETQADLGQARRTLVELWAIETHAKDAAGPEPPVAAPGDLECSDVPGEEAAEEAARALAAFDAGRAAGEDLEVLFQRLAEDIGVETPKDEGDTRLAPDFPGVVGAMVEEFLWDVGRERGGTEAARCAGLRHLSEYGSGLGVFEELGRRELLDFGGRWLLDRGELSGPEEARGVLSALSAFCRWCEERHEHPLWSDSQDLIEGLLHSVPRLVLARRHMAAHTDADRPWRVKSLDGGVACLSSEEQGDLEASLGEDLVGLLQVGDLLHGRPTADGFQLSRAYPSELFELLEARKRAADEIPSPRDSRESGPR